MNQRIRRLTVVLIALFGVLFIQASNWQVLQSDSLKTRSGNNRSSIINFDKPRGQIVTADGIVIADTKRVADIPDAATNDRFIYQRQYPLGELFGNITGYFSYGYGSSQLERVQNDVLTGTTARQQLDAIRGGNEDKPLGTVQLTLDSRIQAAAKKALGDREGSVVVMHPVTGAVLAMYSNPGYDPNVLSSHNTATAGNAFTTLTNDDRKPLLANAYQERYMPGSTFKVLTTTIGLETGTIDLASTFKNERAWVPPNTKKPIRNYGKKVCGGDLPEVFRRSCNIPFAKTAVNIGPDAMVNGVNRFGLDEKIPFDLPGAAASTFGGMAKDFNNSLALLAIHGFGQGQVQITPLHMAMIAASVGNGGTMMKPYVVDKSLSQSGAVIRTTEPSVWKTPMAASTATTLNQLMIGVVQNGTATCCLRPNNVSVAAKTGTAQLNAEGQVERSHAWIMGFAPAELPQVAFAVFIKGVNDEVSASTGGRLAGPVATQVLNAIFALPK